MSTDYIIIGAGVFGLTAAIELRARGNTVVVIDPGPIPHPLAASTDLSKVVRLEYGADATYMDMMERARDGWLEWNERCGDTFYYETGVAMLTSKAMAPGDFEHDSFVLLKARGHRPERLRRDIIRERFPAWAPDRFVDGFFHAKGGWADSGRVVEYLAKHAADQGVTLRTDTAATQFDAGAGGVSVTTQKGDRLHAGRAIVAAGVWTPDLVPELASAMVIVGQPVFHLQPKGSEIFEPPQFPVFTADIATTGWYGFPVHPTAGIVKIANHGAGVPVDPARDRPAVTDDQDAMMRQFVAESLPDLDGTKPIFTRLCPYCDTFDGNLWIDRHPEHDTLVIAAGGSGHAFKFAPILGTLIADAADGRSNPDLDRFRWRDPGASAAGSDAARHRGT